MLSEALNGKFYQMCTMLTHIITRYTYSKYKNCHSQLKLDNYLMSYYTKCFSPTRPLSSISIYKNTEKKTYYITFSIFLQIYVPECVPVRPQPLVQSENKKIAKVELCFRVTILYCYIRFYCTSASISLSNSLILQMKISFISNTRHLE